MSAILDFEFATRDARVMEMSVVLVRLLGNMSEEEPEEAKAVLASSRWDKVKAFLCGYGRVATLTDREIQAVGLCLKLRKMISFLHRLGQFWDSSQSNQQQPLLLLQVGLEEVALKIEEYVKVDLWVARHSRTLQALCREYLLARKGTANTPP